MEYLVSLLRTINCNAADPHHYFAEGLAPFKFNPRSLSDAKSAFQFGEN
jgi:hypothetical protein